MNRTARNKGSAKQRGLGQYLHGRRLLATTFAGVLVLAGVSTVAVAVSNGLGNSVGVSHRAGLTSATTTTIPSWTVPSNQHNAPTVLSPGGADGGNGNFNAVSCPTAVACVAVGGDDSLQGIAGSSSNGGGSWKSGTVEADLPVLNAVNCFRSTACVAVGQGAAVTSVDGGVSWTSHTIPTANTTLLGVSCWSATGCVGVGVSPGNQGPYQGKLLLTTNGGSSWSVPSLPTAVGALGSVDCPSSTFCVSVGASILVSTDGGSTWTQRSVPGGTGVLRSVSCTSATTCVALGPNPAGAQNAQVPAYMVRTTDAGATWSSVVLPPGTANLFTLSCAKGGPCDAVGTSPSSGPAVVIASSDGGASWSPGSALPTPVTAISSLVCTTSSSCVFLGRTGGGAVAITSSSGGAPSTTPISSNVRAAKVVK